MFSFLNFLPYRYILVFFTCTLALGVTTGEILMSISSIGLAATWLLEGSFSEKFNELKKNKWSPLVLSLMFFLILLGLIYSKDLNLGFKRTVMSLPFLLFPIVFGTIKRFDKKELQLIFAFFLIGILFNIGVGTWYYSQSASEDIRSISVFISHIRLSLWLALALYLCLIQAIRTPGIPRFLLLCIATVIILFLRIMESGTGYIALLIVIGILLIHLILFSKQRWIIYTLVICSVAGGILGVWRVNSIYNKLTQIDNSEELENLPVLTPYGEAYVHDTSKLWLENGHYIWINFAPIECKNTWNEVSSIPYDSTDLLGQPLQGTILRYLTSKGMRKDRDAILSLSEDEIREIENGKTSCIEKKQGFSARVEEVLYEIIMRNEGLDPNGHSVVMRFLFLEAGWNIFKDNAFIGIGTGSDDQQFKKYYADSNSLLNEKNRLKPHNQFLTLLVTYGVIGFILFLFIWIYPLTVVKFSEQLLLIILLIALGMITDDLFQTQAGVAFGAGIYSFFIFQLSHRKEDISSST